MELKEFKGYLFLLCYLFFIAGILFDGIVTYTSFSANKPLFNALEANKEIVTYLNSGEFPVSNFIQTVSLLTIPALFYYLTTKYSSNKIVSGLFIISCILLVSVGTSHLDGGYSWLR